MVKETDCELKSRVRALAKDREALILAHNYCLPEIIDAADHVGDSLELSRIAARNDAQRIIFCGVRFMAETAVILSPDKAVHMPDENAGCQMANMITDRELAQFRAAYPDSVVVTYVNSSAGTKALSDICCTSANALEVVRRVPEGKRILFVPDRNLGAYCQQKTGREIVLWQGFCPVHERMLTSFVQQAMEAHPDALVVMHPECPLDALELADHVSSTTGMLRYCAESSNKEFIIGTESGLLHRLRLENPEKHFYAASPICDCYDMKLTTLEKLCWCLEDLSGIITVPRDVAEKARIPIERMLEVTGG